MKNNGYIWKLGTILLGMSLYSWRGNYIAWHNSFISVLFWGLSFILSVVFVYHFLKWGNVQKPKPKKKDKPKASCCNIYRKISSDYDGYVTSANPTEPRYISINSVRMMTGRITARSKYDQSYFE
jgi:hypothetical protein